MHSLVSFQSIVLAWPIAPSVPALLMSTVGSGSAANLNRMSSTSFSCDKSAVVKNQQGLLVSSFGSFLPIPCTLKPVSSANFAMASPIPELTPVIMIWPFAPIIR